MIEYIPFAYPLVIGVLAGVVGFQFFAAWRKDEKARTLRMLVRGVDHLTKIGDDSDPVALAKRLAEEAALKAQLQALVAKL